MKQEKEEAILGEESSDNIELRYDDTDTKEDDLKYFEENDDQDEQPVSRKSLAFLLKPKRKSERAEKVEDTLSGAELTGDEGEGKSDSEKSFRNSNSADARSGRHSSLPGEAAGKQDRKSVSEGKNIKII